MSERNRNMWIGESGRGLLSVHPLTAQNLGRASLEEPSEPVTTEDAVVVGADTTVQLPYDAWAKGRSLDDLVPRSWQRW